jgi:Animal haem peroxidase
MPSYNQLRTAYGLAPKASYTAITGESTASFPHDRLIDAHDPIDDRDILDFTSLRDDDGNIVRPGSDETEEEVAAATRRTTLAARLRALYGAGNVDKVDAFVGMLAEPHVPGTQFGELQLAIWTKQFEALRDGDRFFYLNDPLLASIRQWYGIDYRHTLAAIIRANTGISSQPDVFKVPASPADEPAQ